MEHCRRLFGKDVNQIWNEALIQKAKTIRVYFSSAQEKKVKTHKVTFKTLMDSSKEAVGINKNKLSKAFVIFPMVLTYFEEKENLLFKLIDVSIEVCTLLFIGIHKNTLIRVCNQEAIEDNEIAKHVESSYPILIVRGKSIYDQNAISTVVYNGETVIFCSDIVQGILIVFICYYAFGFTYVPGLEKTLEFIQR